MPHIVAGHDPEEVHKVSQWAGLEGRAFQVLDPAEIAKWLVGVKVVVNCAGPFDETAIPLAKACMMVGAHYLDITDRATDHLAMQGLEAAAVQAGVMLLPGVGSSLLPADCLAKLVIAQVSSPTHLTLAFQSTGKLSKGIVSSRLEGMHEPGDNILMVEDVVTTGGQAIILINQLREQGLNIIGTIAVLNRAEGANEAFANENIPFWWLFSREDFGF